MQTSEALDKFAPAFVKAQAAVKSALKTSTNPHFRSNYADLSEVWSACREALAANGIGVVQSPGGDGVTVTMTTRLLHDSGQWVEGTMGVKPSKADPQGCGSAVTYTRRYALASMVGVVTEDDDGNAASAPVPTNTPAQRSAPSSNGVGKRKELTDSVREWSGVAPEDVASAMSSIKRKCGIKTAKASDEDVETMLAFVKANRSKAFEEAVS